MARRVVVALLAAFAPLLLSACVGPARTDDAYAGKAAATADDARSAVETAIVVIRATRRHGLPMAYVSTVLEEAEGDASAALSSFESIQPPNDRAGRARRRATSHIGDAVDLLADARISGRRGDVDRLVSELDDLRQAADDLDRLASDLRAMP